MVLESIKEANISAMEWPSQRSSLNPIENLWAIFESWVHTRKPVDLNRVYQFCQEQKSNIQPQLCQTFEV